MNKITTSAVAEMGLNICVKDAEVFTACLIFMFLITAVSIGFSLYYKSKYEQQKLLKWGKYVKIVGDPLKFMKKQEKGNMVKKGG